jgi:hypothetical protein
MLKQVTAIFLLLAFMAMTFSRAVIMVDFYINQDYIAKTSCENRDKPMLHCCGKCQLHKRLAKEDNQDKNNPERRSENRNEVLFCQELTHGFTTPFMDLSCTSYPASSTGVPIDQPSFIFHPPAARLSAC